MITDKDPIKIELIFSILKEHIRVLLDLSFYETITVKKSMNF